MKDDINRFFLNCRNARRFVSFGYLSQVYLFISKNVVHFILYVNIVYLGIKITSTTCFKQYNFVRFVGLLHLGLWVICAIIRFFIRH